MIVLTNKMRDEVKKRIKKTMPSSGRDIKLISRITIVYVPHCPLSSRVIDLADVHPKLRELVIKVDASNASTRQKAKELLGQYGVSVVPCVIVSYKHGLGNEVFVTKDAAEFFQDLLLILALDNRPTRAQIAIPDMPKESALGEEDIFQYSGPVNAEVVATRRKAILESKLKLLHEKA